MLITRFGFKAFNEYDLSTTLEDQLSRMREEVGALTKSENIDEIPATAEKFRLTPLAFDIQKLTVDTTTANVPAEYFPNNLFVDSGKRYQKEVLVFRLPYIGEKSLLHCVPSTRVLWTEDIALDHGDVIFELIKFSDDVGVIRQEKDRIINFLTQQGENVNRQIEQYNKTINQVVADTETQTHSQISKQKDFLAQLGIPARAENFSIIESAAKDKKIAPRITDKKVKIFDVFICHASEDKIFVDQMADALKNKGVIVWYDSFQIGWGDDLRPAIDGGLKNSRYGIVVFSKAFLQKKKWTEYELNSLFSKEKKAQNVILPVWHNITQQDISEYSPAFADRIAKRSDDIPSIVKELKNLLACSGKQKK